MKLANERVAARSVPIVKELDNLLSRLDRLSMAPGLGSLLLAGGTAGKRYSLPNTRIMIHQPHLGGGGIGGQVTDIEIHARELVKTKEKLTRIYEKHTGQAYDKLFSAMERDNFMSPTDAKEFGIIDHIVETRKTSLKKG